jgi:hypothetical protein
MRDALSSVEDFQMRTSVFEEGLADFFLLLPVLRQGDERDYVVASGET